MFLNLIFTIKGIPPIKDSFNRLTIFYTKGIPLIKESIKIYINN
jgi:hypothetical protein